MHQQYKQYINPSNIPDASCAFNTYKFRTKKSSFESISTKKIICRCSNEKIFISTILVYFISLHKCFLQKISLLS